MKVQALGVFCWRVRHMFRGCLLAVCLGFAGIALGAQTFDATHLREPADLGSTWLVQSGDDLAYARPDFDDSRWIPFDPNSSIKALFPKGDPETIWYRLHVKVDPSQTGLALREQSISRAFEVYVNGERLITSGKVAPFEPYTIGALVLRRIPDREIKTGLLVIAMRVHISPAEWRADQDPGFFATNLTLGQEDTLARDDWLTILGKNFLEWLDLALLVAIGIVALVLFSTQRSQSEYLWLFALGLIQLGEWPYDIVTQFWDIPIFWKILTACFYLATPLVWVSMFFAFVGQRIGRRFRIFLVFAGILNCYSNLGVLVPSLPGNWALLQNLPFIVTLSIVVPVMLTIHFRRGNREAGILLVPVLLFSIYIYAKFALVLLFSIPEWRDFALRGFNMIDSYQAGPFALSLDYLSGILSTLSLAIIMLLRSTSMSRRQAQLEGELAAAQEVQQVILPEEAESIPGFTVESIYQPAQQVGGDFFQVLPTGYGGLLLVLGDVAGKGLPAAMLVSVMVGAIRATAEYTQAPAEILANLNDRLIGRSRGGFSTALAAHITRDGGVTIANAGHLYPYLDGREIELPGALPLGIAGSARYETTRFHLNPGSRLTFYSDGVIEAQNELGELFGFERGREISTQPAAEIVEAAKQFGQSDDITVVAITRAAAAAVAA